MWRGTKDGRGGRGFSSPFVSRVGRAWPVKEDLLYLVGSYTYTTVDPGVGVGEENDEEREGSTLWTSSLSLPRDLYRGSTLSDVELDLPGH